MPIISLIFTIIFLIWLFLLLWLQWENRRSMIQSNQTWKLLAEASLKSAEAARLSADACQQLVKEDHHV